MASSWIPNAASGNVRPDRGLAVKSPDVSPDKDGQHRNGSNAFFANQANERVYCWVNKVEAAFGLSGSTGQGPTRRDFYPHNLIQTVITISGQSTNYYEYRRLLDFIALSHQYGVLNFDSPSDKGVQGTILRFLCFLADEEHVVDGKGIRGKHEEIDVEGFVSRVPVETERFVNAPPWSLDFTITNARKFLNIQDSVSTGYDFQNITELTLSTPTSITYAVAKPEAVAGDLDDKSVRDSR